MKGIELPINVLVIIIVAVIVLLGVVALYMGGGVPGFSMISTTSAKNNACAELQQLGCGMTDPSEVIMDYDVNGDGRVTNDDTLELFCSKNQKCHTRYAGEGNITLCCKVEVCGCTGLPRPIKPTTSELNEWKTSDEYENGLDLIETGIGNIWQTGIALTN